MCSWSAGSDPVTLTGDVTMDKSNETKYHYHLTSYVAISLFRIEIKYFALCYSLHKGYGHLYHISENLLHLIFCNTMI